MWCFQTLVYGLAANVTGVVCGEDARSQLVAPVAVASAWVRLRHLVSSSKVEFSTARLLFYLYVLSIGHAH